MSIRYILLVLCAVLFAGCKSEPAKPAIVAQPAPSSPADWIPVESKQYGISLRVPPGWKIEDQANVKPDAESKAQADQFGKIQVAFSAVSAVKASLDSFPDSLTAVYAAQKDPKPIDDKYAAETLSDLKTNFPSGDAKVELITVPAGQTLRAVYKDVGTLGMSNKPANKDGKTIPITVVQIHLMMGNVLYVVDLTGATKDEAELVDLADRIALTIKLG